MILDTSVILALFFHEPDSREILAKIATAPDVGVGAPTLVEAAIVLGARLGPEAPPRLARLIERGRVSVIAFESAHWQAAAEAWTRFGRGRHPAGLNFGDCLSYATARLPGHPLLCKGDDFSKTDLPLA